MCIAVEGWRVERESKLGGAIIGQIESFRERYEQRSPGAAAWSRLVAEWNIASRPWVRREPNAELPQPPTSEMLQSATAALVANREAGCASDDAATTHKLNGEELAEKGRRWRHLWAKVEGLIVAFESEHKDLSTEDRSWVHRVAEDMRRQSNERRAELVGRHPGMPRTDDIDAVEIVRALYDLGDDDFDERDDENCKEPSPAS